MRTRTGGCMIGDLPRSVTAVIFGVDVVVDSAQASAAAWKSVFDPFLRTYAAAHEHAFVPFEAQAYLRYMHGVPRLEGACAFLASCGITLPYDDLRGLAMRQEEFFLGEVCCHGVRPFASATAFVDDLRRHAVRTAAVAVEPYGSELLRRAGVAELFDVVLDGLDAPGVDRPEHLDVHLLLEAAKRLETSPLLVAVIEDSAAALRAARCGGFAAVIGVDRTGWSVTLGSCGADLVVAGLSDLRLRGVRVA